MREDQSDNTEDGEVPWIVYNQYESKDSKSEAERLREEARDRYGNEWVLETTEYADGDVSRGVFHTVAILSDGVVVREHLWLGDDGFETARYVVDTADYIETAYDDAPREVDRDA